MPLSCQLLPILALSLSSRGAVGETDAVPSIPSGTAVWAVQHCHGCGWLSSHSCLRGLPAQPGRVKIPQVAPHPLHLQAWPLAQAPAQAQRVLLDTAMQHCRIASHEWQDSTGAGYLGNMQHAQQRYHRGSLCLADAAPQPCPPAAPGTHTVHASLPRHSILDTGRDLRASPVNPVLCDSGALCTPHLSPFSLKVPTSTSTTWPTWAQSASAQER